MTANYGGTEIYGPLDAIFSAESRSGFVRQIFVLTDGAVSNDDAVIALARRNAANARLFALGLGDGASRRLVKGLARAGGGTAAFAATGEDLRPKVMAQLKNGLQPAISNVRVQWVGVEIKEDSTPIAKEPEVETKKTLFGFGKPKMGEGGGSKVVPRSGQAPLVVPPVYDGSRLLVYRLFDKEEKPTAAKVIAQTPDGDLEAVVKLEEAGKVEGNFVHQLAARKRIQDLEVS